jgi:hypothetical protein
VNASASVEADLLRLRQEMHDALSTSQVTVRTGAHAGASAHANAGPEGADVGGGIDAFVGADGTLDGTLGDDRDIKIQTSVNARVGVGGEVHAGVHADAGGIGVDIGGSGALGIGGGGHVSINVNPGGLIEDVRNLPRNIDLITDILG